VPGPSRPTRLAVGALSFAMMAAGALTLGAATTAAPASAAPVAVPSAAASTAPRNLTIGQLAAPVDLDDLHAPLLGWQVSTDVQSAYEVQVATTRDGIATADVWDSQQVESSESTNVPYAGPALSPANGYYWRVRTWDGAGSPSGWSAVSHFGTGPGNSWDDAKPIWTPGIDSGWADYTFQGTFNIVGVAASVNFRAKDSNNFYMWQFRASDATTDPSTLKTHANVGGSYGVLEINALPFALTKGIDYDFRIVVNGSNISTYLKPSSEPSYTFVNSIDNSSFTAGGIGFRTGSTESARYDNLLVTDPTGKVLYSNDFSGTSNDFTCGTVSSGQLLIGTSKNCNYGVDWQNYAAQATFNITQGTAAMSLKGTTTTSYYLWQLKVGSPGTVQINKQVSGTFTTLKTVTLSKPIVTGTDYVMKVVALGNTYQTYLDGVLVDTITDSTFSTGRIGFRTGSLEAFKVKDVTVTTPDGQLFYSNAFATGNTDFSCGTVADGTLTVPTSSNCIVAAPSTNWAFLRGDVDLEAGKQVAWAHLYATGGSTNGARQYVYKMSVNGHYVGVGPTRPIGSETRYDGYDVTSLLDAGATNTIGALAYTTSDQRYLAELVVRYTDGSTQTFGTGSGWQALNGSAVLPDAGSIGTSFYSAPKENFASAAYPFGFDKPGFDATGWKTPAVKTAFGNLVATPTAKVERQLRQPASVVETSPGSYFIDYGRTWVGGLSLDLTGTAGQAVDIRYGEVTSAANTVKYATDGGNNYEDVWTLKDGNQHLETWGMRVFRYVNVSGAPTGLTAADFPALAYVYPYDASAGVFESSNSDLNQVWQLSKNTIEATNGNLYVDSWERERGAYEADSYLQMMSNFYTSADPTLGNYSIAYLFKQRTWPTEWPIYTILAMHDSYAQTGDIKALATYYTTLQGKLPEQWFEPATGLIRKTSGSNGANCTDCDIVDWPTGERDGFVFTQYNTVINAISYRAYSDMAEIATSLGKTDDAATYADRAAAIRTAVNERMWDASKGAYRDGLSATQDPTDHWAVQASVFATAFGLADDAQAAQVATYLGDREAANPDGLPCSVYCSAFVFETLYNGDRGDIAYNLLTSTKKRTYLNMIADGAGATAEAWDKSLKSNLTYSHPWAASVAYNVPQGMFGIRPTTAGYDTFDVKPQGDSLDWAHVTVPTLRGSIGVAFDKTAAGTDVGVHVPGNTVARVFVPTADPVTEVYVDGHAMPASYSDGYAVVSDVTAGCHVLSLASGTSPGEDARLTGICPDGYTAPAPRGELSTTAGSPVTTSSFPVNLVFDQDVTGLTADDLVVTHGSVSDLTGTGHEYSFTVTAEGEGDVVIALPAGAVVNGDDVGSEAVSPLTVNVDLPSPAPHGELSTTAGSPVKTSSFPVNLVFDQDVTGLTTDDLVVTHGSVSDLTGSGHEYSFTVTAEGEGDVVISLPAGAVVNGDDVGSEAVAPLTVNVDLPGPAPHGELSTTARSPVRTSSFPVNLVFDQDVTGLTADDLVVTHGSVSDLTGTGHEYSFTVTAQGEGEVTVTLAAGAVTNSEGTGNAATTPLSVVVDLPNNPTVSLVAVLDPSAIDARTAALRLRLSGTGAARAKVQVTSSRPGILPAGRMAITGSGRTRTVLVTPSRSKKNTRTVVTVTVSSGAEVVHARFVVHVGGMGSNRIVGTAGIDVVFALDGNDTVLGRGGDDLINGGPGADRIRGGAGDDVLMGGTGRDRVTGGAGADVFLGRRGRDTWTDFDRREGDVSVRRHLRAG
jgi:Ca2+-binding RTX toxin-like protein